MEPKSRKKKLPEEEIRKIVPVKFNEKEKKILQEKALIYSGGNISKYIRSCSLKETSSSNRNNDTGISKEDFFAMVREINKQGTNLNQLVKFYNSGIKKEGDIYFLLKAILEANKSINEKLFILLGN